jgi:hypothetical protein
MAPGCRRPVLWQGPHRLPLFQQDQGGFVHEGRPGFPLTVKQPEGGLLVVFQPQHHPGRAVVAQQIETAVTVLPLF